MPTPVAKCSPEVFRDILLESGFSVIHEDQYFWYMAREVGTAPLLIPKEPAEDGCVSFQILEHVMYEAQISLMKYLELKKKVEKVN